MTAELTPQMIAWLDQEDAAVRTHVREHGVHLTYVSGDACCVPGCSGGTEDTGPSFGYTTGLFELRHPELLVFGVGPETTFGLLNTLAARVRAGERLESGALLTLEQWDNRVVVEKVPNPGDIVYTANRFYRRRATKSVPVLQLSYDDDAGRFPWERGYTGPAQPRPGTFRA